jgi:hypothetical protein
MSEGIAAEIEIKLRMPKETLINDIKKLMEDLAIAKGALQCVEANFLDKKEALDAKRNAFLSSTDPKDIGANEAQREARLAIMFATELEALTAANSDCAYDKLELEGLRDQLKCYQMLTALTAGVAE